MSAKSQAHAEQFTKLQAAGTATTGQQGVNQADAELYKVITTDGTAALKKNLVSQSNAELYHRLSGT